MQMKGESSRKVQNGDLHLYISSYFNFPFLNWNVLYGYKSKDEMVSVEKKIIGWVNLDTNRPSNHKNYQNIINSVDVCLCVLREFNL